MKLKIAILFLGYLKSTKYEISMNIEQEHVFISNMYDNFLNLSILVNSLVYFCIRTNIIEYMNPTDNINIILSIIYGIK